jgi:hypothetical protein
MKLLVPLFGSTEYFSDVKKFALFLRDKNVRKITDHDIEQ